MLRRVRGPIPENQIDPLIARDAELTWANIQNKPATFPPEPHTHTGTWETPQILSPFILAGGEAEPLKYRLIFDRVEIIGAVQNTTSIGVGGYLTVFSLPINLRPKKRRRFNICHLLPGVVIFVEGQPTTGGINLMQLSSSPIAANQVLSFEFSMPLI